MKVRVGGVPEHFNLAWHMAIEGSQFSNIEIDWHDIPGGTGAMCKALRAGELDMAIALTEGVISDIMAGNSCKIVQFYVNSPLRWGIYTSAQSNISSVAEMQGNKYAISRYKSGSHLMAYVNAHQRGLTIGEDDFLVVGNLEGAREALRERKAQLFMWEKFTTKPLVDSGEFKMIGECATPWPCFVIAATNEFIEQYPDELAKILNTVNLSCLLLKNNSHAPQLIAKRYSIKEEDAKQWFKELEYACEPSIDEAAMNEIFSQMLQFRIIDSIPLVTDICYGKNVVHAT
jgi:sulfonate transport system substrate-binding protein